jgi:ABC-type uncharacterized transport system permease subunit
MPVFADRPCRLLCQPRADHSRPAAKKQRLAAHGDSFRGIALICHAFALESRIIPGDGSVQNLSVLNVGSLVSLMICTVMTIVASKIAAGCCCRLSMHLRADQSGLRHLYA